MANKDKFIETTPRGLSQDAEDFFYAYELIKNSHPYQLRLFKIRYYLLGHALELSFKSFLLEHGVDLRYLKKNICHNIIKCLNLSKQKGLNVINTREEKTIEQLNSYYQDKQFEYSKNRNLNLPTLRSIEKIVVKLLNSVKRDF